jgi:hypothetical protein
MDLTFIRAMSSICAGIADRKGQTHMKYGIVVTLLVVVCAGSAFGQFRGMEPKQPSVTEKVGSSSGQDLILGFINPANFSMSHNISMSYMSFGAAGVGVTKYTNSMRYQISEPLSMRADVAFMTTPFGSAAGLLKNDVNKIYIERAQLDYKPSKDVTVSLQFRQYPEGMLYPYAGMYGDPRYSLSPFSVDNDR